MKQRPILSSRRQQGAVLIVSLLLLLVITILALGAGQSTRDQERQAGLQRNYDLSFQASEAGLRAGERMIESQASRPDACNTAPCAVYERGLFTTSFSYEDQAYQPRSWWTDRAQNYVTSGAAQIAGGTGEPGMAKRDPQFYIEELEFVPDSLRQTKTGKRTGRVYYRVISRGEGGTENVSTVLHSTYVRRY